ncbi:MAG: sulfatase-like hydrolase/transferase [Nitrospirae bacterium]|nr:sulfatase-like hydrolase/transferase [Nitrospirota bacterium]
MMIKDDRHLSRQIRVKTFFSFLVANYIISLIISYPYLSYGPSAIDFQAWVYTRIAFLSNFAIFIAVLGLFLWPFTRFIKSSIQLFSLPPIVMFLFQVFLLVDVHIYEIFRFHINGIVINTLTTEGAGDSVQVGKKTLIMSALLILFILLVEFGILLGLYRYFSHSLNRSFLEKLRPRKPVLVSVLLFLMLISADKFIFAYANFYDMNNITRYQKLYPMYLPLFADKAMEKYLGMKKEKSPIEYKVKSSLLNYPSPDFKIESNLKPINIVWIALDSWRFDMMNEEITPHISEFSRQSLLFENHYSGGNATRFGIFPMFYGIYGTYWHQILAERKPPVFMDTLQGMGYDFKILSSTQLTYPEFRKTAFVKLPAGAIDDELPGKTAAERDLWIGKRFEEFIERHDKSKPFFSFMFLDSPHAPYRYTPEFARYQPAVEEIDYLKVKKANATFEAVKPVYNRYRNAVYFSDYAVNQILTGLKKRGLLKNTIVAITGDHGEEFYETGFFGHTSSFSRYQVHVPFILYVPGEKPAKITKLTSHLDIVPTMLSLMGSKMNPSLYAHGRSLLGAEENHYVVSSGWDNFAVIDKDAVVILSTEIYNAGSAEVRLGQKYEMVDNRRPILAARSKQLLDVTKNLSNFLK